MSVVVPIAHERVEIDHVWEDGRSKWLMSVVYGAEVIDRGFYLTRAAAVDSAKEWSLPIRFVRRSGDAGA